MMDKINNIKESFLNKLKNILDLKHLEELRIEFLGKKGEITSLLKNLSEIPDDERPKIGALINSLKKEIEEQIELMSKKLKQIEQNKKFELEKIDITLPGRIYNIGARHPISIIMDEIEDIFLGMGFNIEEGPEVETDYYNFTSMNFEDEHPARDSQDTFYIKDNKKVLLRTHTSPVQSRTMKKYAPNPIRVICPGRVYRKDNIDATHSIQFHQVEGLLVDKNVKFSDLIGILQLFAKKMFGEDKKIRLRPSFFPFTEPSAEVDISCIFCSGKGCQICKGTGWLEILGSGCVHPNVLKMGGYDPEIYSGWAFGMGCERIALLKYQINDIRLFFENDLRFLKQFK